MKETQANKDIYQYYDADIIKKDLNFPVERLQKATKLRENGSVVFDTNNAGGILGGISNGNDIVFRVAVKPVPSIFTVQKTVCKVHEHKENNWDEKSANQTENGEGTISARATKGNFQKTLEKSEQFETTDLQIKGRHDICLCPRIVPVVEAMTNIVLADMILRNRCAKI